MVRWPDLIQSWQVSILMCCVEDELGDSTARRARKEVAAELHRLENIVHEVMIPWMEIQLIQTQWCENGRRKRFCKESIRRWRSARSQSDPRGHVKQPILSAECTILVSLIRVSEYPAQYFFHLAEMVLCHYPF